MTDYGSLREKIAAESAARRERYKGFDALYAKAREAGMAAGNAAMPQAMVVTDTMSGQRWDVPEGVCGFAWVTVRPGNSSFARWASKKGLARKAYEGGMQFWISEFGQSMTRKEAYARAFAGVLREAGIKAYSGSRMD